MIMLIFKVAWSYVYRVDSYFIIDSNRNTLSIISSPFLLKAWRQIILLEAILRNIYMFFVCCF